MSTVAVVKCETYDEKSVFEAVSRGIDLLGGMNTFIGPGEKILLKPNLLAPELPEKCVTTHPAVFRAVADAAMRAGAVLSYGDSPAMGNTEAAARKCGFAEVAEQMSIPLADFKTGVDVRYENGVQNKKFTVAKGVVECDGLISIPKIKTHGLEKFTGAVKNQFGCVPGLLKGEFHVKVPDSDNFAKMLLDLNAYLAPRLYVMDGVMAMEGNGPRGGHPVHLGVIVISADPIALDSVVCRIINVDPELVPTVKIGAQFGMGKLAQSDITLVGDPVEDFIRPSFKIDRKPLKASRKWGMFGLLKNRLVPKPVIKDSRCLKCGVCVRMCPAKPKAVNWAHEDRSRIPEFNYSSCIRCYCCQELCPESAIVLKKPFLRHFF